MNIILFVSWLCIIHLLVFSIMLSTRGTNKKANKALSGFLLCFAYMHFTHAGSISLSILNFYIADNTGYIIMLLAGPLYLQYTGLMTGYNINWRKHMILHAFPFIPAILNLISFLFKSEENILRYYEKALVVQPWDQILLNSLNALQMGFYIVWSLILINRYNKNFSKETFVSELSLRWLKHLTIMLLILCFVIGPALEMEGSATLMQTVLPVATTLIYLFLFYKSVNFPGSDYEKRLIEDRISTKISRDLHDGVGQLVTAVKMNLDNLLERIPLEKEEDRYLAKRTTALVEESYNEIRELSHQINSHRKNCLANDVKNMVDKIGSKRLKVNLRTSGFENSMKYSAEAILFRVIQETVNNVLKHSRATQLDIHLKKNDTTITAMVKDNGVGFDPGNKGNFEGIGLRNINTRVEQLNGKIKFVSSPGNGTNITIQVPVA